MKKLTAIAAGVVLAAGLAGGLASLAHASPGTALASTRTTVIYDAPAQTFGWSSPSVKPNRVTLDGWGNVFVHTWSWAYWTSTTAESHGTLWANTCTPDCAAGHYDYYAATLKLHQNGVAWQHALLLQDGTVLLSRMAAHLYLLIQWSRLDRWPVLSRSTPQALLFPCRQPVMQRGGRSTLAASGRGAVVICPLSRQAGRGYRRSGPGALHEPVRVLRDDDDRYAVSGHLAEQALQAREESHRSRSRRVGGLLHRSHGARGGRRTWRPGLPFWVIRGREPVPQVGGRWW